MKKHLPITVLIVEDDPIIAEDILSLLNSKGFEVIGVAHTGLDAVNTLASSKPDFILLDIHLGSGMTGIDVAEIIHEKYHLPYIFLTSFDDEFTFHAAEQFSPYGYLVKPFQDRSLITTIKVAIANFQLSQKNSNLDLDKAKVEQIINQNLTDQEFRIIIGLIHGLSYKQLADKHMITKNTVKYHVGNIYNKCDISRRSDLIPMLFNN